MHWLLSSSSERNTCRRRELFEHGVFVGLADLVPLVGSLVGGLVVALVAFASVSLTAALITVGFHLPYGGFEDYMLNPRVSGIRSR